ncbi:MULTISPECIES: SpaH/EbpB family LPXTG-anchored major pilin [unclassified Corynebacterium]
MTASKKIAAAVAATTLTLTSGFIGAGANFALAQETGTEPTLAPNADANGAASVIDANHDVALNIEKYVGEPGDTSTPLPGAMFRVERVNGIDLTNPQDWAQIGNLNAEDDSLAVTPVAGGNNGVFTTGDNGQINLTTAQNQLSVGVYRVTEVQFGNYTVAAPFFVTLPYDNGGTWEYTRTVQPKNQDVSPNKQVKDDGVTVGKALEYTINAPVPAGELNRFNIVDNLVANLTAPAPGDVSVATNGDVALAAGDYNTTVNGQEVRVNFTPAGLAKLQEARQSNPSLQVNVGINAVVNSVPAGGVINNTATVELPNGQVSNTDDGDTQTNTVFGNLAITKTSPASEGSLNGATFELYQCTAQEDGNYQLLGDAVEVSSAADGGEIVTEMTTSGGGADDASDATANGYAIPLQSTSTGATGTVGNTYCVLETQAPDGFVRNPQPQPVNVDIENRALSVSVENQRDSIIGQLPATGAWGILIAFLVGMAFLARGLYTSYKDSRTTA